MCQNRGIKTKIYKETGVSTHWEKILTILPSKSHVEEWSSEDKSSTNDVSVSSPGGQRHGCDDKRRKEQACEGVRGAEQGNHSWTASKKANGRLSKDTGSGKTSYYNLLPLLILMKMSFCRHFIKKKKKSFSVEKRCIRSRAGRWEGSGGNKLWLGKKT